MCSSLDTATALPPLLREQTGASTASQSPAELDDQLARMHLQVLVLLRLQGYSGQRLTPQHAARWIDWQNTCRRLAIGCIGPRRWAAPARSCCGDLPKSAYVPNDLLLLCFSSSPSSYQMASDLILHLSGFIGKAPSDLHENLLLSTSSSP